MPSASSPPPTIAVSPGPSFWLADPATQRPPNAFGALPPERQATRVFHASGYELAAPLPTTSPELDVYVGGRYADADRSRIAFFPEAGWEFVPALSLIQYAGERPLGPARPIASDSDARDRATFVLTTRGLLPSDMELTHVTTDATRGTWRVWFSRRIGGYLDYANKGMVVTVDAAGQVRNILARRRPLLERSAYRTRSPEDAWSLLAAGRGITMYLDDGAPTTPAQVDRFVVRSVEIAYAEGEVLSDSDIVRPYYVFRGADRQTMYVSAIADDLTYPP